MIKSSVVFKKSVIEFVGVTSVNKKTYKFQVYSSITHLQCTAFCTQHPGDIYSFFLKLTSQHSIVLSASLVLFHLDT